MITGKTVGIIGFIVRSDRARVREASGDAGPMFFSAFFSFLQKGDGRNTSG
jgi:hypothetical protein